MNTIQLLSNMDMGAVGIMLPTFKIRINVTNNKEEKEKVKEEIAKIAKSLSYLNYLYSLIYIGTIDAPSIRDKIRYLKYNKKNIHKFIP